MSFSVQRNIFLKNPTNQQNQQTSAIRNHQRGRIPGREKENPDSGRSYRLEFLLAIFIVERKMLEFLNPCCSMFLSASLRNCHKKASRTRRE